jgi:hypothetical protein
MPTNRVVPSTEERISRKCKQGRCIDMEGQDEGVEALTDPENTLALMLFNPKLVH